MDHKHKIKNGKRISFNVTILDRFGIIREKLRPDFEQIEKN